MLWLSVSRLLVMNVKPLLYFSFDVKLCLYSLLLKELLLLDTELRREKQVVGTNFLYIAV